MTDQAQPKLGFEDIAARMATDLYAFVFENGPDVEADYLKHACEEFPEEVVKQEWADARAKRHKAEPKPQEIEVGPQTVAAQNVSGGFRRRIGGNAAKVEEAKPETEDDAALLDAAIAAVGAMSAEEIAKLTEDEEEAPQKANLPAVIPQRALAKWDDALAAMNDKFAIIENVGGKSVIACWEPSLLHPGRRVVIFQNKESFLLRYSNRYVTVETHDGSGGVFFTRKKLGEWWLGHRDRAQYCGVTFLPGGDTVVGEHLNLWQGWGVDAAPGDWSLLRWHMENVIAGGNEEFADYVVRWIAWSIQNPAAQAEVALVLIGNKGAGKGTLVRCLQRIFGAHAFQVTSREEVIGKFNGHLQDCILFVADEAYWGGDKRCVGRLQGMITEPTLPIERKGIDLIQVPNYLHVLMLAEPGWVIPAGRFERRYAAFDVSEVKRGDHAYFRALHNQIASNGAEAMMYDLQRTPLDGWHPREIPESLLKGAALQRQQAFTLPPLEQWYLSVLRDGRVPGALVNNNPNSKKISRPNTAYTKSLREDAIQRFPRLRFELSDSIIEDFMTDESWVKAKKFRDSSRNGWTFEPLTDSRKAFDRHYGPQPWNKIAEWGEE